MPDISLLCPTRGRPESMRRLVESAEQTAEGPIEVVFVIDDDDPRSAGAALALASRRFDRAATVRYVIGERVVLSECWNIAAREATADVLMHCGDDIVFNTQGWDRLVLDVFDRHPDKLVLVHGDDLVWGPRLATHSFLHRRWMEALGYFCPPYFSSDYNDTWLTEVADRIGRRVYLPEVVTEHLHPAVGKATWDVTHRERLARGGRDNVHQMYIAKEAERKADAEKLRAAMQAVTA